jgi:hypothetical protein
MGLLLPSDQKVYIDLNSARPEDRLGAPGTSQAYDRARGETRTS